MTLIALATCATLLIIGLWPLIWAALKFLFFLILGIAAIIFLIWFAFSLLFSI